MEETTQRQKLFREFSHVNAYPKSALRIFDAVVVLSAEEVEVEGENKRRIDAGLNLIREIKKNGAMIFLGTVWHIKYLEHYLSHRKINFSLLLPTKRRHESSRTQIRSLADFLKKKPFSNILVVSHAYHIPRVKRYCAQYLTGQKYDFYPVGQIKKQTRQLEDEIDKIIKYAQKGDLPLLK